MKTKRLFLLALALFGLSGPALAERYNAYWDGKEFLILDSESGHMWSYQKGTLAYNGRIDGDEFVPPKQIQIWNQYRGQWSLQGGQ